MVSTSYFHSPGGVTTAKKSILQQKICIFSLEFASAVVPEKSCGNKRCDKEEKGQFLACLC